MLIPAYPSGGIVPVTCGLLMHMQGASGGAVFIDEKGHTVTNSGSPVTSTTQAKYGKTSYNSPTTSDFISVTSDAAIQFGSGDFTVEAWIYPTSVASATYPILGNRDGVGTTDAFLFYLNGTGAALSVNVVDETGTLSFGGGAIPVNTWTHVAFTRSGSTNTLWVNGSSGGTQTNSNNISATTAMRIGSDAASSTHFVGFIQEVMMIKGTARYTGAFTPSISPYEAR